MPKHVTDEQLVDWFGFHPADTNPKRVAHEGVRTLYGTLAETMNKLLPEGPDKTVALRSLREAAMQANMTLACNGGPSEDIAAVGSMTTAHILSDVSFTLHQRASHPEDNPYIR